jgi:hypothetical protein
MGAISISHHPNNHKQHLTHPSHSIIILTNSLNTHSTMAASSSTASTTTPATTVISTSTTTPTEVDIDEVLDEKTIVEKVDSIEFAEALSTNASNGKHAEVKRNLGGGLECPVNFMFKDLYSRFGVSEDEDKKNPGEEKKKDKTYGIAFPMRKNPQLLPVQIALDKRTASEYSKNSKAYAGKQQNIELAQSLMISFAREGKAESFIKYGANFKCKFDNNTEYYLRVGKFDRPCKLEDVLGKPKIGKPGTFTIMGYISKMHLAGKFNLVFQVRVIICNLNNDNNKTFRKFVNLETEAPVAAPVPSTAPTAPVTSPTAPATVPTVTDAGITIDAGPSVLDASSVLSPSAGLRVTTLTEGAAIIKLDDNGVSQ